MQVVKSRKEIQEIVQSFHLNRKSIGFVPTMGFLHEGHLRLVQRARAENDIVIVSIFVNPTQFGPNEDFENYPRDFEHDRKLLEGICDYIFFPQQSELYAANEKINFQLKDITDSLCGLSRPDHFPGVCQILSKLFYIVQPNRAYFGQKDYQQTVVVRHLVKEFFFSLEVVVCPTVREPDGLAMSSRNIRLSTSEREKAPFLYQSLQYGLNLAQDGEENPKVIIQKIENFLREKKILSIDYIDVRDAFSLAKIEKISDNPAVIALAVFFKKVRLIDNILYTP